MRYNRKLDSKRKQRINRLIQKFDLLDRKDDIRKVWGWKARRRTVHSLAYGGQQ
jgi:hypothetical protein